MTEPCWAFLAADFEAAARDAAAAVADLWQLASDVSSRFTADDLIDGKPLREWLEDRPEWISAQQAIASQLRARAALEDAGLELPADARETAERAQFDLLQLGLRLSQGRPERS